MLMALSLKNLPSCSLYKSKKPRGSSSSCLVLMKYNYVNINRRRNGVKAMFSCPTDQPIVEEALKEPVAFVGGMFAGLLRLDLNDDPLKEWVTRTVEAAGITEEEIGAQGIKPEEEVPEQIEIE